MLTNSLKKLWTKTLEVKDWFAEQDRELMNPTPPGPVIPSLPPIPAVSSTTMSTVTIPTPTATSHTIGASGTTTVHSGFPTYTISGFSGYATGGGGYTTGLTNGLYASGITINSSVPSHLVAFYDHNGAEILRVEPDGTVIWKNGVTEEAITEAQNALSRSINLTVESKAGIVEGTKRRIRDQVFEEIIEFAKQRGALTADDLTFMLESSKIIEKLKGV